MNAANVIGIVGGVGPHAGLDLARKIFDHTIASTDQEHLPVALLSYPDRIANRTAFVTGKSNVNPAYAIDAVLQDLERLGATVAGIACNSAHSLPIFDVILQEMAKRKSTIRLLHIVEETARFILENYPAVKRLGLLATIGTVRSGVYPTIFQAKGLEVLTPGDDVQTNLVHRSVDDPEYGIKAKSDPVTSRARNNLLDAAAALERQGAQGIILGCTEIPLAIPEANLGEMIVVDPTVALARALIREACPAKLRPLQPL